MIAFNVLPRDTSACFCSLLVLSLCVCSSAFLASGFSLSLVKSVEEVSIGVVDVSVLVVVVSELVTPLEVEVEFNTSDEDVDGVVALVVVDVEGVEVVVLGTDVVVVL